ncbi:MAG TPA: glycosyltransferase family 4 protein [Geobacteraceae bacterium]|nr:glycosyltransferase family 4 protein [Geobacteraceae bacterium]
MSARPTVWFISEVYHPDEQGTAFYTTGLAEGLAAHYPVGVLCSFPTVTARGVRVARKEVRNGVAIERCGGTTFNKDVLILRLVNILTYSAAIFFKALTRIKSGDVVLAVTSPPSAPFIARLVCFLRNARCVLRVEDVYPEILVATGMLRHRGLPDRVLRFLTGWLYRSADRVIVLGRDMKALAEKKMGGRGKTVQIIRSWADTDVVSPLPKERTQLVRERGLHDRFVVSCVGNMGRAQAIEFLFDAVTLLRNDARIHFLFIGGGARRRWMEQEVAVRGLKNVTLLDQRPREEQMDFLNACDVSVISLLPGVTGAGVPSRTYNIMAAGKPVIAVTEENSEVALLVRDEAIGWVAPPRDPACLAWTILDAMADRNRLTTMGEKASRAARERFPRERVIADYGILVKDLLCGHGPCGVAQGETLGNLFP